MADNYVQFSEQLVLKTDTQVEWWKKMILDLASKDPVLGYELDDMREDIQYAAVFEVLSPERETPGSTHVVWIHDHEGNGEPILAMRVVQAFFGRSRTTEFSGCRGLKHAASRESDSSAAARLFVRASALTIFPRRSG